MEPPRADVGSNPQRVCHAVSARLLSAHAIGSSGCSKSVSDKTHWRWMQGHAHATPWPLSRRGSHASSKLLAAISTASLTSPAATPARRPKGGSPPASAIQATEAFGVVPKVPGVGAPLFLVLLVLGGTPARAHKVRCGRAGAMVLRAPCVR